MKTQPNTFPELSVYNTIIDFIKADIRTYRKVPKFSDTRKLRCNLPKIQTKRPNLRVLHQNNANGMANSEGPDQTAPRGAV